eukprot:scaffold26577_cov51-Isochrysis_galbana.AAC.1
MPSGCAPVLLHRPDIPPMHASDRQRSLLSPTRYDSPLGHVHSPPHLPATLISMMFEVPGGYCGGRGGGAAALSSAALLATALPAAAPFAGGGGDGDGGQDGGGGGG